MPTTKTPRSTKVWLERWIYRLPAGDIDADLWLNWIDEVRSAVAGHLSGMMVFERDNETGSWAGVYSNSCGDNWMVHAFIGDHHAFFTLHHERASESTEAICTASRAIKLRLKEYLGATSVHSDDDRWVFPLPE